MDLLLLVSVSIIIILLTFIIVRVIKLAQDERRSNQWREPPGTRVQEPERPRQQGPVVVGGQRKVARRRHVPTRRADAAEAEVSEGSEEEQNEGPGGFAEDDLDLDLPDDKIGKKKLAKLQAKAEKRAQRDAEVQDREDRKKREAEREEKRKKEAEKEKLEEQAKEEAEKKAREERERQEHEEYLKMRAAFSVEQEGYEQEENLESQNLLQEFIDYVKRTKAVNMDELAARFKLRTVDVVERIKTLVADGILTGVIDDRGKFIYITTEELQNVAKFINQRGRVSVAELVDYSNQLIQLEPTSC